MRKFPISARHVACMYITGIIQSRSQAVNFTVATGKVVTIVDLFRYSTDSIFT